MSTKQPLPSADIIPHSFIKNISLQLRADYDLENNPFPDPVDFTIRKVVKTNDPYTDMFIGREQHRAKFLKFLMSKSKKGIFLVTGYRGMGKTSFVNRVIKDYKQTNDKKIIPIHLTLAQNNPKEIDILRLMVTSIKDEHKKLKKYNKCLLQKRLEWVLSFLQIFLIPAFFVVIILVAILFETRSLADIYNNNFGTKHELIRDTTLYLAAYFFIYFVIKKWISIEEKADKAANRIKWLADRCYATVSEENINNEEINFQGINTRLSGNNEKKTKLYPIASNKEIEYELQQFLKKATEEAQLEFIFIFDELDKVEPTLGTPYFYDDNENKDTANAYEHKIRDRKQAVINIITGLKNFFTTANARFIFIAGREMFDASLADVADRQSSISSIFTFIFNIESFLKERNLREADYAKNNASLTYAIEEYLKRILFPKETQKLFRDNESLFTIAKKEFQCGNLDKSAPEYLKLYFTLQNFVTFLTYRSNGSPKKIIKEIHEFIVVKEKFDEKQTMVFKQKVKSNLYLHFNYYSQYHIGFISYLYRPFLIKHGRSYKFYSDNIIQSTPYLFDHLLKFHPFAFSLSNLELIPEVLSTSKTPALREHVAQIIDHLSLNHLREIEIGVFSYKFYSRTINEITFLSKISEQEAAALNFTLDESYLVKMHVIDKIKELRTSYAKFIDKDKSQQIFSITHLNGILGDLHFFDQEYNDAILAYSDAIRPIDIEPLKIMSIPDFITLIRAKLKIGLCFEKINSFEKASAQYSQSSRDVVKFLSAFDITTLEAYDQEKMLDSALLRELLQIIIQCFLAEIFIKEKMRLTGVRNLNGSISIFLNIADMVYQENDPKNLLIKANLFLNAGNLLYYKNSIGGSLGKFFTVKGGKSSDDFAHKLNLLVAQQEKFFFKNGRSNRKPIPALYMYIIGLCEIIASKGAYSNDSDKPPQPTNDKLFNDIYKEPNIVGKLLEIINVKQIKTHANLRGLEHRYIAYFLSCIGDCLLGAYEHSGPMKTYNDFPIDNLFNYEKVDDHYGNNENTNDFYFYLEDSKDEVNPVDIIKCYYFSGEFFLKNGRNISGGFQFRKILHVLRLTVKGAVEDKLYDEKLLDLIKTLLVRRILKITSDNIGNADIHMAKKAADVYLSEQADFRNRDKRFALNNISNHPDSREAVLLFNFLKIKLNINVSEQLCLISSNNTLATQYCRIMELDFHAKHCYHELKKNLFVTPNSLNNDKNKELVVNYLYSMLSLLRILDIYKKDYMVGYRFCAFTHYNVGAFLIKYRDQLAMANIESNIDYLLGEGSYASLDHSYHFKKAKILFEKTVRLHSAGTEYKHMINDIIYLEDDYNDNAQHFGAAMDRYLMINDVLKQKIENCNLNVSEVDPDDF